MGIFNSYTKPGKGLSKEDLDKSGLALYFDILFRRFWKFISINFMYVIASIPAIIIASFIAYYFMSVILSISGVGVTENGFTNEGLTLIRLFILPFTVIVLQITGSGPASVAKNYMLRKYVKDTHVWLWSDFISSFKKNFWQGMAVYLINTLVCFVLFFSMIYYYYIMKSDALSTVIVIIAAIFFIMQKYVYMLVSGFELKIKHIYRNSALFAIVGLKWNLLSSVVILALMWGVGALYLYIPAISVAIILSVYFSIITFTQLFITRSVVTKYLEEPAMEQEKQKQQQSNNNQDDDWE